MKLQFLVLVVLVVLATVEGHRWGHPRVERKSITGKRMIGLYQLNQPESIVFDQDGLLYTGLSDGRIMTVNLDTNEISEFARVVQGLSEEQVALCGSSVIYEKMCGRPLGLAFDGNGDLLVMDAYNGLKRISSSDRTVTTLVSGYQGQEFNFSNSVVVSGDGKTIYFTETTGKYVRYQFLNTILSNIDDGRLFKYDIENDELTLLASGFRFPNGLAFGSSERKLIFVETTTRNMYQYNLRTGSLRILTTFDCFPDNIAPTSDGNYLVGCFTEQTNWVDLARQDSTLSSMLLDNVSPTTLLGNLRPMGIIKKVNSYGRLVAEYTDETGAVIAAIAEAHEHNGKLYIGSVILPYLGEIDMETQLE